MSFQVNLTINNKTKYKFILLSKPVERTLAALLPISITQLNFTTDQEFELLYTNELNETLGTGTLKFGENIGLSIDKGNITVVGYNQVKLTISANTVTMTQVDNVPLNILSPNDFVNGGNVTLVLENVE